MAPDGTETDVEFVGSPELAAYELREADSKWPRLVPLSGTSWTAGTFKIEFRAGYCNRTSDPAQSTDVIPVRLMQAMELHAEAMYDRDEKMMQILLDTAERLVKSECINLGFA